MLVLRWDRERLDLLSYCWKVAPCTTSGSAMDFLWVRTTVYVLSYRDVNICYCSINLSFLSNATHLHHLCVYSYVYSKFLNTEPDMEREVWTAESFPAPFHSRQAPYSSNFQEPQLLYLKSWMRMSLLRGCLGIPWDTVCHWLNDTSNM